METFWLIVRRWFPFSLAMAVTVALELINISFIGYLGDEATLAAAGIAHMYFNMCGLAVIFGMNSALETLCGQAVGASNYKKAGEYFYRGMMVITVGFLGICIAFFFSRFILTKLGL